jgi:hypothetical protein
MVLVSLLTLRRPLDIPFERPWLPKHARCQTAPHPDVLCSGTAHAPELSQRALSHTGRTTCAAPYRVHKKCIRTMAKPTNAANDTASDALSNELEQLIASWRRQSPVWPFRYRCCATEAGSPWPSQIASSEGALPGQATAGIPPEDDDVVRRFRVGIAVGPPALLGRAARSPLQAGVVAVLQHPTCRRGALLRDEALASVAWVQEPSCKRRPA